MRRRAITFHLAALHVAQEARRAGSAPADYPTRADCAKKYQPTPGWGDNLDPVVPVRQPMQRELPIPEFYGAAKERDVLAAVLVALRLHPRVAWVNRMNVGRFKLQGAEGTYQWVNFGWRGMADITGQLVDGRRLEVECKRAGEEPTADQAAFLANVKAAGGVAFVARGVDDVMRELAAV